MAAGDQSAASGLVMTAVLSHRADTGAANLRALWDRLGALGWLPVRGSRIVVQVGRPSELAVETAASLAARLGGPDVEVLESEAAVVEAPFRVAGIAVREGLRVPARWFEPHVLVTVTTAGPAASCRLSGALDAQAAPLRRLGNPQRAEALAYEAHRLAASDLVIVCGNAVHGHRGSDSWWAIGPSDVGVDRLVAQAAGATPETLPYFRELARHEILPDVLERIGDMPRLEGHLAPAWQSRLATLGAGARAAGHAVARDVVAVRRNLDRVPGFVRRRLAVLRRVRDAA